MFPTKSSVAFRKGLVGRLGVAALALLLVSAAWLIARVGPGGTGPCERSECEIELTLVGHLIEPELGTLPDHSLHVTRDSRGRLAIIPRTRDRVFVFDPGGLLYRTLGDDHRLQFHRLARLVHGPDDHLFVYDASLQRTTVFDTNLRVSDVVNGPLMPSLVLADGRIVVAAQIPTAQLVGHPLHLMDRRGRIIRSFGMDPPEYYPGSSLLFNRLVTHGSGGTLWTAALGRYVLEQWDPATGTMIRRLTISSPWFTESTAIESSRTSRPGTIIEMIWESNSVLWVLMRDADMNWHPRPQGSDDHRPHDAQEYDRMFDWVIEAIDVASGAVLATRRFDSVVWGQSSSPLLTIRRSMGNEQPAQIDVFEPKLNQKEEEQ